MTIMTIMQNYQKVSTFVRFMLNLSTFDSTQRLQGQIRPTAPKRKNHCRYLQFNSPTQKDCFSTSPGISQSIEQFWNWSRLFSIWNRWQSWSSLMRHWSVLKRQLTRNSMKTMLFWALILSAWPLMSSVLAGVTYSVAVWVMTFSVVVQVLRCWLPLLSVVQFVCTRNSLWQHSAQNLNLPISARTWLYWLSNSVPRPMWLRQEDKSLQMQASSKQNTQEQTRMATSPPVDSAPGLRKYTHSPEAKPATRNTVAMRERM